MNKKRLNIICRLSILIVGLLSPAWGQFSIFLPNEAISPEAIERNKIPLAKIELMKDPIVSEDDLISYSKSKHELDLKTGAFTRIFDLEDGTVVIVCVNRKPVYWAQIWNDILSVSCGSTVILRHGSPNPKYFPLNFHKVSIECGYPSKEYFQGQD